MWNGSASTDCVRKLHGPSTCSQGRLDFSVMVAVSMMGAVSPATRVIPRTEAVRTPGMANGRTDFLMVCQCVAPRANDASRKPLGTALRLSSHAVMMTGRTMMASVQLPAMSEVPQPWKLR